MLDGLFARAHRSGIHCRFTTKLWKMLVVRETNPAVWIFWFLFFVVFAELIRTGLQLNAGLKTGSEVACYMSHLRSAAQWVPLQVHHEVMEDGLCPSL